MDARLDPTVLATAAEEVRNLTDLTLTATVETSARADLFRHFSIEVERRCPVMQLFRRSDVNVSAVWSALDPAETAIADE